ncbi:hypothetical protein ASPSYDRAFT_46604 [Aspergillus sydowii CBS 593.65]|uniref:Uncharacterized protein n=1 Tax=Aspergillus sydowii CBS 593.65 TaxID=1036612 RepID=A0A1L9TDF8_9EURO|nr:uncharacterized protein ASPSYDRAFT_46604 [Aspergillus sydowii CBS 593.65]OJJ57457.1 hypothetical protein ASPSYDRAFT_46604 [Aspergillus sydowii CBS 593.65]
MDVHVWCSQLFLFFFASLRPPPLSQSPSTELSANNDLLNTTHKGSEHSYQSIQGDWLSRCMITFVCVVNGQVLLIWVFGLFPRLQGGQLSLAIPN